MSLVHHTTDDHAHGCALVALLLAIVTPVATLGLWGVLALMRAMGGAGCERHVPHASERRPRAHR